MDYYTAKLQQPHFFGFPPSLSPSTTTVLRRAPPFPPPPSPPPPQLLSFNNSPQLSLPPTHLTPHLFTEPDLLSPLRPEPPKQPHLPMLHLSPPLPALSPPQPPPASPTAPPPSVPIDLPVQRITPFPPQSPPLAAPPSLSQSAPWLSSPPTPSTTTATTSSYPYLCPSHPPPPTTPALFSHHHISPSYPCSFLSPPPPPSSNSSHIPEYDLFIQPATVPLDSVPPLSPQPLSVPNDPRPTTLPLPSAAPPFRPRSEYQWPLKPSPLLHVSGTYPPLLTAHTQAPLSPQKQPPSPMLQSPPPPPAPQIPPPPTGSPPNLPHPPETPPPISPPPNPPPILPLASPPPPILPPPSPLPYFLQLNSSIQPPNSSPSPIIPLASSPPSSPPIPLSPSPPPPNPPSAPPILRGLKPSSPMVEFESLRAYATHFEDITTEGVVSSFYTFPIAIDLLVVSGYQVQLGGEPPPETPLVSFLRLQIMTSQVLINGPIEVYMRPKFSKGEPTYFFLLDLSPIQQSHVSPPELQSIWQKFIHLFHHDFPASIVLDPIFLSKFWHSLFLLCGTHLHHRSDYQPLTDGQTEIINRSTVQYLRVFTHLKPTTWASFLSWAEFSDNTSYCSSSGMTPFQALGGRLPPTIPPFVRDNSKIPAVEEILLERDELRKQLKPTLRRAQHRMKLKTGRPRRVEEFQVGDTVLVRLQPSRQISVSGLAAPKLARRFHGTFTITEQVGPVAYCLELYSIRHIHPVSHVSALKPFKGIAEEKSCSLPPDSQGAQPILVPIAICSVREVLCSGKFQSHTVQLGSEPPPETFRRYSPQLHLEDKVNVKEWGMLHPQPRPI